MKRILLLLFNLVFYRTLLSMYDRLKSQNDIPIWSLPVNQPMSMSSCIHPECLVSHSHVAKPYSPLGGRPPLRPSPSLSSAEIPVVPNFSLPTVQSPCVCPVTVTSLKQRSLSLCLCIESSSGNTKLFYYLLICLLLLLFYVDFCFLFSVNTLSIVYNCLRR